MTKDEFQKAVDDAITDCIRNDYSFGSYARKVTAAVWPVLEAAEKERDALRAKIEAMERQKPVGKFAQHPSNGLWEQDGYGDNPDARPLYALPGAQGEEK